MAKSPKLFKSQFSGYKKDQVDDYIAKLKEEKNEEIAKLSSENKSLKAKLDALTEAYDKMYKKQGELLAERNLVTKTLVDAEKRADQIITEAVKEGEDEKNALSVESEKIKKKICDHEDTMKNLDSKSKAMLIELIDKVRTSADIFESELMATMDETSKETESIIKETNEKVGITEEELPNIANDVALDKEDSEEDSDDDSNDGDKSQKDDLDDLSFASSNEGAGYFNTESA